MTREIGRLLGIMAQLRHPDTGCEWDRVQTFASIAPYTIEEAYEVADAIAHDDMGALRDELGDLMLQVVFHAQIAKERGVFDFGDVVAALCSKLEKRHPHIFAPGENLPTDQETQWETIKAQERSAQGAISAMDGVAMALPALLRAEKLQKRAARQGFDWPDQNGPRDKVFEELEELEQARSVIDKVEEAGDLLFAAVNVVRSYGVAPEDALRMANIKFERRFRAMEALADDAGNDFSRLSLSRQEALWQQIKSDEKS